AGANRAGSRGTHGFGPARCPDGRIPALGAGGDCRGSKGARRRRGACLFRRMGSAQVTHVWHYGLMAEYWALFKTDAPEAPFFIESIRRFGEPVLDLGCGTGRILLPLLRAGLDADGCDVSRDMLRWAKEA